MHHTIIPIDFSGHEAKLHSYFIENTVQIDATRKRPLVLVCPGGGYAKTSDREAESVAIQFLSMGYHAAVLHYSVAPARYPVALCQLAKSIVWLKQNAHTYAIDADHIFVCGFSAAGHLAASLGVSWNEPWLAQAVAAQPQEIKAAGLILSYPVITSGEFAHQGSFENLLGSEANTALRESVSLENQVNATMPPVFLWHTVADQSVPVENSFLLAQALRKQNIPFEMHIFPSGGHGLSLATQETKTADGGGIEPSCASWIDLARTWLQTHSSFVSCVR